MDLGVTIAIIGVIICAVSLYYTRKQTLVTENQASATQENMKVSQEGQIAELLTRAIDQLGNEKIEIRIGGIYSLERISKESEKDYWPIMEILTAYIRKNSSIEDEKVIEQDKLPLDIQVILTIIGRRKYSFHKGEDKSLELQGTYLQNADLKEAHLEGVNFGGACLEGSNFEGARLEGAILNKAHLEGVKLRKAHLEGSDFIDAHLDGASLIEAYLEGAKFTGASLKGTNFMRAHLENATFGMAHLEGSILGKAHLERAKLIGAHLEGAYLMEAHLEGSNLLNAHLKRAILIKAHLERANLTDAQLEGAYLEGAHLEGAILMGAHLKGVCFDGANLEGTYLIGASNLTVDQLSKVKTLYKTQLDKELCESLERNDPEKYHALINNTEQTPEDKKTEILSVTYIFRRDPVTDELRALTADEFQQLIDKGIDPKHTTAEEISILCGWLPAIKTHYCVKGQESFVTNEYLNWTSEYGVS